VGVVVIGCLNEAVINEIGSRKKTQSPLLVFGLTEKLFFIKKSSVILAGILN